MISLRLDALFPRPGEVTVWACSEDGTPTAQYAHDIDDGWLTIEPSTDVPKYRIAPAR